MFRNYYKHTSADAIKLQENRRQAILEDQRKRRELLQDEHREVELTEYFNADCESRFSSRQLKKQYNTKRSLQLSEWMREEPEDLGDWFLVPCPRGQRCIVVACNNRTAVYNKNGRLFYSFRSLLPGSETSPKNVTMLDCIYLEDAGIFYVLDTLAFGSQDLLHCEAEFRFFWLRCRFEENDFDKCNSQNEHCFQLLERFDLANEGSSREALLRYPFWSNNSPELDGFLFYHKKSSYICGPTPLVCWLFPFMLPDVLGLKVSSEYVPPANYSNPQQYMDDFSANQKKKKRRHPKRHSSDKSSDHMEMDEEEQATESPSASIPELENTEEECIV